MLRVFCITNDTYLWCLKPFCYLFNVFWSELQPVVILGYNHPDFPLPPNFEFYSIDNKNYPQDQWSNALIKFLNNVPDEHFVLMLDDYWLMRTVDHRGIVSFYDYMRMNPDILKFDLTSDRMFARGDARDAIELSAWGCYDIVFTPVDTPYNMSLQAAIWNKSLMLQLLLPNKSPWETEIHIAVPESMRVVGSKQCPVRYANGVYKGKVAWDEVNKIPQDHRRVVENWIKKE